MNRRKIIIISGASGVGKGSILKELLLIEDIKDKVRISKSFTTREPRYEDEKQNYNFMSVEQFEARKDFLVEYNHYAGAFYATSYMELEQILFEEDKNVILEIDPNGMEQIKKNIKNIPIVSVFIVSEVEDLIQRLIERGTEDQEQVCQRLKIAIKEVEAIDKYDYVVVNNSISSAAGDLKKIILEEAYNMPEFDQNVFQEKIKHYLKTFHQTDVVG